MAVTGRGRRIALAGATSYAAANLIATVTAGKGEPVAVRGRIPATFVVMHVAWGGVSGRASWRRRAAPKRAVGRRPGFRLLSDGVRPAPRPVLLGVWLQGHHR